MSGLQRTRAGVSPRDGSPHVHPSAPAVIRGSGAGGRTSAGEGRLSRAFCRSRGYPRAVVATGYACCDATVEMPAIGIRILRRAGVMAAGALVLSSVACSSDNPTGVLGNGQFLYVCQGGGDTGCSS